jgi:ribosome-associated protein
MEEMDLDGSEFIQLCDLLKRVGFCATGGQAKSVIGDGMVKVDGNVELRKRCKIRSGQTVEFQDQTIQVR